MRGAAGSARTVAAPTELHSCVPADSIGLDGSRSGPTNRAAAARRWSPGDNLERALLDVLTCIRLGTTLEDAGAIVVGESSSAI